MKDNCKVAPWVKQLVADVFPPSSMKIGAIIDHPEGYRVKVVDGQYWGEYGVSNFWYWRRVNEDGTLGEIEHGYGW